MFEILKLNEISPKIYKVFDANYSVSDTCQNPDAILVRSANMLTYEPQSSLLAVARAGAGVNNIPIPVMSEKGVVVFNTPGANANAVKELTLCALFLTSRGIVNGINWASGLAGKGAEVAKTVEKGKGQFGGCEIEGKTLAVIGLGAIGVKVANAALGLGMDVIGYDPYITEEHKKNLFPGVKLVSAIDEAMSVSDYVTLHIPFLESTKELMNANMIARMKDGAILINMSRGELVNVADVKSALISGKMKCYAVDFPTDETLNVPAIIAIPHLGASTEEAEDNCAVMAAAQIKDYLENGNIKNSVNFPTLVAERKGKNRVTVAYNTGKGVIAKITALTAGVAAFSQYAERKDIGYMVIDTDTALADDEKFIENVSEIEDITLIRFI